MLIFTVSALCQSGSVISPDWQSSFCVTVTALFSMPGSLLPQLFASKPPPPSPCHYLKARQWECGPEIQLWRWVPTCCQCCFLPPGELAWLQHHHSRSFSSGHTHAHTVVVMLSRWTSVLSSSLNMPFQLHYYSLYEPWICVVSCHWISGRDLETEILLLMTASRSHNWPVDMSLSIADVPIGAEHWPWWKESFATSIIQLAYKRQFLLGKSYIF